MVDLPGIGNDESDEEKARRRFQEKTAIQDNVSTNKMDAAAMQSSEQDKKASNELLNPEADKQRIKQLLLNVEPVQVRPNLLICDNCGNQHRTNVDRCKNCSSEELKIKQGQPEIKFQQKEGSSLINEEGFNKVVWSEIESAINVSVSGGYMPSGKIGKLNYSTLSTVTMQMALYWYMFGVDNPSDMQQVGDIIRHPLIANTSKARGGRGLKNQESTRIEKFARTLTGDDGEEGDDGLIF